MDHLSAAGSSATRNLTTTEPSESLNRRKTVDFRFQRPHATSRSFFFNKPMRAMDSRRDFTSKKVFPGTVLIIKGVRESTLRWENPARAIPPRIPPRNPPQTDPNQAEPCKGSEPLLARRPYVARGTHGARTVPHRKSPHTRHANATRAPGRVRRQGAERSHMHGHMYSDSLGAAAGCAPERSSLAGGVPSVSNAGPNGQVSVGFH